MACERAYHSTGDRASMAFELAQGGGGNGASPGAAAPARPGDIRLDMRNAVAPRGATCDRLAVPRGQGETCSAGGGEARRERLSQTRKAVYDAARSAAPVVSPFRHALKSVMFLKRVRRRTAAIAFCPRLLQPSSSSSPGPLAQARPF